MRRLLPVVLLAAMSSTAAADGFYFSEAVGGTKVSDELSATMSSAVRIKVAIGMRRRNWAVEGWVAAAIAADTTYAGGGYNDAGPAKPCPPQDCGGPSRGGTTGIGYGPTSLTMYGIDIKYLQPVSPHIELYLRGGLSGGIMEGQLSGYGGRGLGLGAGVQLKGKVPVIGLLWWPLFFTGWGPKMTAALFVDDGYEFYRLHKDGNLRTTPAIDAQLSHLTIGFALGSDF